MPSTVDSIEIFGCCVVYHDKD